MRVPVASTTNPSSFAAAVNACARGELCCWRAPASLRTRVRAFRRDLVPAALRRSQASEAQRDQPQGGGDRYGPGCGWGAAGREDICCQHELVARIRHEYADEVVLVIEIADFLHAEREQGGDGARYLGRSAAAAHRGGARRGRRVHGRGVPPPAPQVDRPPPTCWP